ncbi:hypothetical protein NPIL_471871 [Nephila pilipes]|uniref:Uncharacterized protein n=1 Tax=Nephila pilipes TaxID=299642 RepID=A0A8X6N4J2_NEPPI|nr:hypothetical protein NPIL_471871 [Nephila pilipes]
MQEMQPDAEMQLSALRARVVRCWRVVIARRVYPFVSRWEGSATGHKFPGGLIGMRGASVTRKPVSVLPRCEVTREGKQHTDAFVSALTRELSAAIRF